MTRNTHHFRNLRVKDLNTNSNRWTWLHIVDTINSIIHAIQRQCLVYSPITVLYRH